MYHVCCERKGCPKSRTPSTCDTAFAIRDIARSTMRCILRGTHNHNVCVCVYFAHNMRISKIDTISNFAQACKAHVSGIMRISVALSACSVHVCLVTVPRNQHDWTCARIRVIPLLTELNINNVPRRRRPFNQQQTHNNTHRTVPCTMHWTSPYVYWGANIKHIYTQVNYTRLRAHSPMNHNRY